MAETLHCVVTGSASGIGLAVVNRLLAGGWSVTGIDRNPHPPEIARRIKALQADLSDISSIAKLDLPNGPNAVAGFVHCAGLMRSDDAEDMVHDAGTLLWKLHVGAAETLIRRLAPHFAEKRARLVVMSSRAAQGRAERSLYAASKMAVEGMVRSFAAEFIYRGITANAIAPGSTNTPMLRDPKRANLAIMPLPFGRLIEPEEIAALIEFLLGPYAGAITGQMIYVCGGSSIPGLPAPPKA
jgi:NAD(P)-dependent dehydrogenase (short-subunit alcohol dehydrogenase family)